MMTLRLSVDHDAVGSLIYPRADAPKDEPAYLARAAPRINNHVSSPMVFTGIFSPEECDRIIDIGARQRQRVGRMMYARPDVRKSRISWIGIQGETAWLYEKIWQTFRAVNRWYEFELLGLVDEIQYAVYDVGDRFDWHLDTGGGQTSTRKISLSVQLADGGRYAGGDLQFSASSELETARRRGTIIAFPSFLSHRVTEVTHGSRMSLVAWAHGPAFR
jgi:PKHD-type hydroxylase